MRKRSGIPTPGPCARLNSEFAAAASVHEETRTLCAGTRSTRFVTGALISALEGGRLGGAALDVLEGEEGIFYADCRNKHIASKPLLRLQQLPNALVSPHTAYYTDHALSDIVENSIINCLQFERRNRHG